MIKNNLILLVIIVFIGCKTEKKNNGEIHNSVSKMWSEFRKSNPTYKNSEIPESLFFHNNEKDADRLAELTLQGKKQASSGLYQWYEQAGADLPKVGTKHIVTNFAGMAKAIIEITQVDTIPFNQIDETYAQFDMGTSKGALKKWKKAHWEFFAQTMEDSEEKPSEDMLVVCERFETVWPIR